jgi:alkylation response protein AidB-like acyl-CoA dehydrogenase
MTTITSPSLVVNGILERVLPVIKEHFGEGERLRRLPDAVGEVLLDSGALRAIVPAALGGLELPPAEFARLVEEISRVDPSAGFIVGNAGAEAYVLLAFPEQAAREVFADRRAVLAGGAFPPAQCVAVPGGYRVTGRAGFASGAHLATWVLAFGVAVEANGQPRMGPGGAPGMMMAVLRRDECELIDNWNTLGLRGSGSHDFAYTDVFVPEHRAIALAPLVNPNPLYQGPLYRARLWAGHPAFAVTALGVARAALDVTAQLAHTKTPNFMTQPVGHNQSVQRLLGRAEAKWRAARAYIYETVDELWQHQLTGDFVTHEHGVDMQLAACFALESAREITEACHEIAGTTGFREDSPLELLLRDAHTLSQHAFASPARYESAVKAMFGWEVDWLFFQL